MKKLQDFFQNVFDSFANRNDEELYLHLLLTVATLYATMVHVGMLIIYLAYGHVYLAIIDMVFVVFHLSGFAMIKAKKLFLAGFSLTVEVIIYTIITTALIGGDYNLIYFVFVTLFTQLAIPYSKMIVRTVFIVILWLCTFWVSSLEFWYEPMVVLNEGGAVLRSYNTQVLIVGIVAQLLVGNFIRRGIEIYRKEKLVEFEKQANTDALTGLENRRGAEKLFAQIREDHANDDWCAAMLDIDDFKVINDTWGHDVGDRVLVCLADHVKNTLRNTDAVIRWGGEEFLILLRGVTPVVAAKIMRKLCKSISEMQILCNLEQSADVYLKITVTIGLEKLDPCNINASIKSGDQKLYLGKRSGKNMVVD